MEHSMMVLEEMEKSKLSIEATGDPTSEWRILDQPTLSYWDVVYPILELEELEHSTWSMGGFGNPMINLWRLGNIMLGWNEDEHIMNNYRRIGCPTFGLRLMR